MSKLKITNQAVKNQLEKVGPEEAVAEYIWNGLDADANLIEVNFGDGGALDNVKTFSVSDTVLIYHFLCHFLNSNIATRIRIIMITNSVLPRPAVSCGR